LLPLQQSLLSPLLLHQQRDLKLQLLQLQEADAAAAV
jgi:hypothetical protein